MFNRVSGPSALGRDAFGVDRPHLGDFGELVFDSVVYSVPEGWRPLFMDVRVPRDPRIDSPPPLVLWIHGGSWVHGSRKRRPVDVERAWFIERLLLAGFAVASIDYRLAREVPFPGPAADVRAALAFVHAHAGDFGIDADRLVVWGESAGAHLGLLTGASSERFAALGGAPDHAGEPAPRPAAIVDWYGPADLPRMLSSSAEAALGGNPEALRQHAEFEQFLSMGWDADAASPERVLQADCPPVLLVHGTGDALVPIGESRALAEKLSEHGVIHEVVELPGGHVFAGSDSMLPAIEASLDFLRRTVGDPFAGVADELIGDPDEVDPGHRLSDAEVAEMREGFRAGVVEAWGDGRIPGVNSRDLSLDGPAGGIPARLHEPDYVPLGRERELPLIVQFHSGGFVVGDLDTHAPSSARLCAAMGAPVLQIDYRLTPEHAFPAAYADAAAATREAWARRDDLGLAPGREISRIVLYGDSAGGALAVSTALELRSQTEVVVDRVVAIYPVLDWTGIALWPGMSRYIGAGTQSDIDPADPRLHDARLAPGEALELQNLPPVQLAVGSRDRVLEQVLAFAYRLKAAGNALDLQVLPAVPHGFNVMSAATPLFAAAAARVDRVLAHRLWEA